MGRRLVIIGAGALGREIHAYAFDMLKAGVAAEFDGIAGFIDDRGAEATGALRDAGLEPGFVESIDGHVPRPDFTYVIGIGRPSSRHAVAGRIPGDVPWSSVIHPTAYVASSATLGRGAVIAPFAFVGINSVVDDHVVLNTYASCGHDGHIGPFSVLSPYAVINGNARLGARVFMGSLAHVHPGRTIGRDSVVAAGASVNRNMEDGSLIAGNPATGRVMYRVQDEGSS